MIRYYLLVGITILAALVTPAAAGGPYYPDPFAWDPEGGYYTGHWFTADEDLLDVGGLFGSILDPLVALLGSWVFVIIWSTFVMAFYLRTQDTTLPFVVGILSGGMMAYLLGEEGLIILMITMAFAGGGILAKTILGRI